MYQGYWQLSARPFEPVLDGPFQYPGESQQAALLKLRYSLENRRGAALLVGQSGVGKTLVAQSLLRHLPNEFAPRVHLLFPFPSASEFLVDLANRLVPVPASTSADSRRELESMANPAPLILSSSTAMMAASATKSPTAESLAVTDLGERLPLQRIERFLRANAQAGNHAVIAIDEAHLLRESNTLETIRLLMNFHHESQPIVSFLLVGQTSLMMAIEQMPDLEERLAVKCMLRRFTLEETMAYVQHRLSAAGATRAIFTDDALESLHERTQGIPRRINRLCDLALLIGFAEEIPILQSEHVLAVANELTAASVD